MFGWAFAEATVWPIIPDALLVPMIVGAPYRSPHIWLASALGSAAGGTALYLAALRQPDRALRLVTRLPAVESRMLERATAMLAAQGVAAFWRQPWSGIAYKIFAVVGAGRALPPDQVLPTAIAARALRMGVVGGVAALAGWRCRRVVRDYSLPLAVGYLALVGYGWWLTQRRAR